MRILDLRVGLVEQGELTLDPTYRGAGLVIHVIGCKKACSNEGPCAVRHDGIGTCTASRFLQMMGKNSWFSSYEYRRLYR
jgi:hypothetical protein